VSCFGPCCELITFDRVSELIRKFTREQARAEVGEMAAKAVSGATAPRCREEEEIEAKRTR
jgi:hypothetical protein